MTEREALKLALEALEQLQGGCTDSDDGTVEAITVWCPEVIDAIKEALAQPEQIPPSVHSNTHQPEQEPFCYHDGHDIVGKEFADHSDVFPLYTTPPQRKPLSDEEIEDEWERITGHSIFGGDRSEGRPMFVSPDEVIEFARAIKFNGEAK